MNYMLLPESYPVMPFYYWSQLQSPIISQFTCEKPQQTREILQEKSAIKIQNPTQIKAINQLFKTSRTTKRSSKKKPKTRKIKKRDMSFSGKSQKENRNYTSILCRTFLLYLAQHPHLDNLINSVINRFRVSFTSQNFIKTFQEMFDLKKSYIRKELVENVCSSQSCEKEFSLVFRVLFRKFLKLQIFPTVFKSNKLSKKVKSKEAKFGKKVYEIFFESQKTRRYFEE